LTGRQAPTTRPGADNWLHCPVGRNVSKLYDAFATAA
jgi:hypothetical protein